jgi:hypothetical protein
LAAFQCFLGVIYWSFARIGTARKSAENDSEKEWVLWFLGAALFTHAVAFWGISYFDQTRVAWFALLTMISAVTAPLLKPVPIVQEKLPGANSTFAKSNY